jgi:hypothetical protein
VVVVVGVVVGVVGVAVVAWVMVVPVVVVVRGANGGGGSGSPARHAGVGAWGFLGGARGAGGPAGVGSPGGHPPQPTRASRSTKGKRSSDLHAFVERSAGERAAVPPLAVAVAPKTRAPPANNQPATKSVRLTTGATLEPLQLAEAFTGRQVYAKCVCGRWSPGVCW